MSKNDFGDELCPACGKPVPPTQRPACTCTAADMRAIFASERAELSRRAAALTARSMALVDQGADHERTAIVAWLRSGGPLGYMLPDEALETLARRIEAGEHIDDSAWREQR